MSEGSAIEWTEATFNPWWGCARVSPACVNCYADTWARRTGRSDLWRRHGARRLFGETHWQEPLKWNRKAEARGRPMLVFCASMADVFEDHPVLPPEREKLWDLIDRTPWLVWQLLTKRPENVLPMAPWDREWPPNVWLGTSVETQHWADARIPEVLAVPAAVRFLSCEPLLGPVDLDSYIGGRTSTANVGLRDATPKVQFEGSDLGPSSEGGKTGSGIDWVIVGGESGGPDRRAMVDAAGQPKPGPLAWARSLRDQAQAAGIPFLFKQWGGKTAKSNGRVLDGRTWLELPEFPIPKLDDEAADQPSLLGV